MSASRVAIVGVDCLTPQLLFDRYSEVMPNVRRLMAESAWGTLASTVPPITVPAWMCMATSQDPGQLGIYGFRNRADRSYRELVSADASWVRAPSLWQILSRRRRRSIVLGVPMTWPPRPIVGDLVSGIPVPEDAAEITAPASLRGELDGWTGGYPVDVRDFRALTPRDLLAQLHRLRETRFDAAERLVSSRPWDLLFMVEMGVDRLHHAFWAAAHSDHPKHVPGDPFEHAIRDYYAALDLRIGRLVERLGPQTAILLVSDHGARTLHGGVSVNEWLMREGLLVLKRRPPRAERPKPEDIDWARTTVWADGGYYARLFLNVARREPEGVVRDEEAALRDLAARFEAMAGPDGAPLGNRALRPRDVYREVNGIAPDLIGYVGDLAWRANATVGPEPPASFFADGSDNGADGANHAPDGVIVFQPSSGRLAASIYDVAPTVLELLGEEVPPQMIGRSLLRERA